MCLTKDWPVFVRQLPSGVTLDTHDYLFEMKVIL
jgi:hypothetical protein